MIFDGTSLEAAVAHSLADARIPVDHTHAFALVATTGGGIKAVLSTRINDIWQVDTVVNVQKGQRVEGGVQVKASW